MRFRFLYVLTFVLFLNSPLFAASKKVYIKSFAVGEGIDSIEISSDIRDYMAEVFAGSLSLITDDEISEYLSQTEFSQSVSSSDEDVASKLLRSIDVDYLVYGKIYRGIGTYVIDATMLELSPDNGVTKKNFGDISFTNIVYADRASRALARYIMNDRKKYNRFLFPASDPRDDFADEVRSVEADMNDIEADYQSGSESIKSASRRRNESLIRSPVIRIGCGAMLMQNSYLDSLYGRGYGGSIDLFYYRYKDPVGDGIDLYARGLYYKSSMSKDKSIDAKVDANAEDNIGFFESPPVEGSKLVQYGCDLGLRFVGSSYFLWETWSVYFGGAGRYLISKESYTLNSKKFEKKISAWGAVGIAGLEVSIIPYLGLFGEIDYAYIPAGENNKNVGGPQVFAGITFRTDHWN